MKQLEALANARVLWACFVATVVCTVAFQVIVERYDLVLLDAISDPEQARAALASMSESQRTVHAWVTGTLDVLYPLVYGALFIGSAYLFFPGTGRWLAIPIMVLVLVDLIEGVVQILALTGLVDWLDLKAVLTATKLWLFYFGFLVTLLGWLAWLVRRLRS